MAGEFKKRHTRIYVRTFTLIGMLIVSVVPLVAPVAVSVIWELYIPAVAFPELTVNVTWLPYWLAVKFPDGLVVRLMLEKPQFMVGWTVTSSLEERVRVRLVLLVSFCAITTVTEYLSTSTRYGYIST